MIRHINSWLRQRVPASEHFKRAHRLLAVIDKPASSKRGHMKSVDKNDRVLQRHRVWRGFLLLMIGAGIGAGAYRLIATSGSEALTVPKIGAPNLIKKGGRIEIPDGSPLRDKLTIGAIGQKETKRNLVLPAVVEAAPARLVKVLPPLAGRVTQLKVQLGEEVVRGQPLAVLDSPDLATAYADYDRAKVLLVLALRNRDRLRDLAKSGGAALREQQQTETDYVTAEVENQRAEARLRQIGVDPDTTSGTINKSRTVTILAPISGSVIDLAVAPGALWNDHAPRYGRQDCD